MSEGCFYTDEEIQEMDEHVDMLSERIEDLKKQLKEKDEMIEELEKALMCSRLFIDLSNKEDTFNDHLYNAIFDYPYGDIIEEKKEQEFRKTWRLNK